MHEYSIAQTLIDFCEKIKLEHKPKKILKIRLTVNPFSCLSREALQFLFRTIAESGKDDILKDTEISLEKKDSPDSAEITIKDIEIDQ